MAVPEGLYVAAYSDDGRSWRSPADGKITLLDSQSGQVRRQWDSEQIEVNALVFDPNDETTLWTTGDDGTVCAWAAESGQRLWRCQAFDDEDKAFDLIYLRDLDRLVVRSSTRTLNVLDASQGRLLEELSIPPGPHYGLQWALDGRHLITTHQFGVLRMYDGATMKFIKEMDIPSQPEVSVHPGNLAIYNIATSDDGRTAALGTQRPGLILFDLERWQCICEVTLMINRQHILA